MGTQAHVQFWLTENKAEDDNKAEKLIARVEHEMQRIDQLMSPYINTSELYQINLLAGKQPVTVSQELFDLIRSSNDIAVKSQGAFDITYASIGYQYNYREKIKPNEQQIQSSLPAINYKKIILNDEDKSVAFNLPQVKIDLGGIAKGHAVKSCISLLRAGGVKHALVSAGGDTALLGDRNGRPWMVGIKHPRAENKTAVHLPLSNEAISTSGDYERYFIEGEERYHHILNPKTGKSAKQVVSVSVIGPDATYVDALSTTVFVQGLKKGMKLINSLAGYEAIIIDNHHRLHFSSGLQQP